MNHKIIIFFLFSTAWDGNYNRDYYNNNILYSHENMLLFMILIDKASYE